MNSMNDARIARRILGATHSVAVVGASENPSRDSHRIMNYLMQQGFQVYPVNPNAKSVLGIPCVARVTDLAVPVDTVVCFRRSAEMAPIAHDAVAAQAKHLWMQYGVINEEAATLARAAGLDVVMDRCIMVDHRSFGSGR